MHTSATLANVTLSKSIAFDPIRDFTPIAHMTVVPLLVMAGPTIQARNVPELIQLARSQPGKLTFGSEGIGGNGHMTGELFSKMAGVRMTHVPFKSAVESTAALAAGQIDVVFGTITTSLPLLKANRYRALAVTTARRSSFLPDVPTLDESGLKGFDQGVWYGFVGPAGMPKAVVDRLYRSVVKAAAAPDVQGALAKQAMEIDIRAPDEFGAVMLRTSRETTLQAKELNLKLE
jgi:tripartite-type tricarboxylate transporter receptor subunit TctC